MAALRRSPALAPALALAATLLVPACAPEAEEPAQTVARSPLLRPERFAETAPDEFRVRFETSAGDVLVDVHRDWAPLGADRFYNLVSGGFYDDTRVYRVLDGFMAQFGLNGDPYVNQAWKTRFLVDDPVIQANTRGRIAFAKVCDQSITSAPTSSPHHASWIQHDSCVPVAGSAKDSRPIETATGVPAPCPSRRRDQRMETTRPLATALK